MSYVSLYRKYRSQTFDDVVGQDHVVKTIRNAIRAGHIAHGYLFCGSRGTGKTTVARLVAKALNCLESEGPTPDPCNRCEACLSIAAGTAVDVIEMDAASNRSVDDVDALREGVKYAPMRLRYKVYIIDEAHQLSPQAKDAFLKTLEEPPPHAVFILATTEASKIPVTIRSRCQQFDFRRGSVEEIRSRLSHVANCEGISVDEDALELIARLAAGSYRDALSILEQVIAYTEGKISIKDVHAVCGTADEDVLLEIGDTLASGNMSEAFALARRILYQGGDVRELLRSVVNHYRDLLALKVGANPGRNVSAVWKAQCEKYSREQLLRAIEIFSAAEKDLRYTEHEQLTLETAFLRFMLGSSESSQMPASASVHEKIVESEQRARQAFALADDKKTEVISEKPTTPSATVVDGNGQQKYELSDEDYDPFSDDGIEPATHLSTTEAAPTGSEQLQDIQRNWQKVLIYLQKVMKRVSDAAVAREGTPVSFDGTTLTIAFEYKHKFHHDRTRENSTLIAQAIEKVTGLRVKVATILKDEPLPQKQFAQEITQLEHPQKDEIITMFDGREVEPGPDPWQEE